jgi:MFS family permease
LHCKDRQNVAVDWNDTWSLDNWVDRFDLACVPTYKIALMGSMYFAGTTIFNLLVTRMGDIYGRKWPVRISSVLSLPVQAAIIFHSTLPSATILFFILGALGPGKCQVGFVYASELLPERHRLILGSAILFMDSSTMLLLPLYHKFITKNWIYFHILSLGLNALAIALMFMVPESPKWLIGKR